MLTPIPPSINLWSHCSIKSCKISNLLGNLKVMEVLLGLLTQRSNNVRGVLCGNTKTLFGNCNSSAMSLSFWDKLSPSERCSKPTFGAKGRKEVLTHMLELSLRDSYFSLRAMQGTWSAYAELTQIHTDKRSPPHHNMSLRAWLFAYFTWRSEAYALSLRKCYSQ